MITKMKKQTSVNRNMKQTVFPCIEAMEMEEIQKEIDLELGIIIEDIHKLIDIKSLESKRNSLKTLNLLRSGIEGLLYLKDHSKNRGVITLSRAKFDTIEKIKSKAIAKNNIEDENGKVKEKVTSEIKIIDHAFKPIDWNEYDTVIKTIDKKDRIGNSGIKWKDLKNNKYRKDIDG